MMYESLNPIKRYAERKVNEAMRNRDQQEWTEQRFRDVSRQMDELRHQFYQFRDEMMRQGKISAPQDIPVCECTKEGY